MDFVQFFQSLENLGFLDAFLPFLLIFTIVFAVLEKTGVLGQGKRNLNILLSAILGLIVVIPHVTNQYPAGKDIVVIMNSALPAMSAIFVAVVLALVLMNLATGQSQAGFGQSFIPYLALLVVLWVFGSSAGWWKGLPRRLLGQDTISIVMIILIFALVYFFIVRPEGNGGSGGNP